jgi:hypothetical protein
VTPYVKERDAVTQFQNHDVNVEILDDLNYILCNVCDIIVKNRDIVTLDDTLH